MFVSNKKNKERKKNGFEREEEDGEDGFIPMYPFAEKEKKWI